MSTSARPARAEIRNDRFKRSYGTAVWAGLIAATIAHFAVFQLFPGLEAGVVTPDMRGLDVVPLPEIVIPPPPEAIRQPRVPAVAKGPIPDDVTISPDPDFGEFVPDLEPHRPDVDEESTFLVVYDVAPRLLNEAEVLRLLQEQYPTFLRDAGVGGDVGLLVQVSAEGAVLATRIRSSSGYPALDEAARVVAASMRFSPAYSRDRAVAVWIAMPVRFQVPR